MKGTYKKTDCRVCGNESLEIYLDLGLMPLANNIEDTLSEAKNSKRYPLEVEFCENCKLSQLTYVIDPGILFNYYTYRSSINGGYRDHCKKMAETLMKGGILNGKSFVIDIAGNDGALLKEFRDVANCKSLNIDPAANLCKIAEDMGISSLPVFWNYETSKEIFEKYGQADIITSTNVFAHVDEIQSFIEGIKHVLKTNGTWVLEFPYLVDLIERNEFDTVYFEHMSYLGIHPVNYLCKKTGLRIYDIEKFSIHGGTVRLKITHENSSIESNPSVDEYLSLEITRGFTTPERYRGWSGIVKSVIDEFSENIQYLKNAGYKISGFAASAKGNTLLNSAGIDYQILDYIADETPEKIGHFSPGTGIPIVHIDKIRTDPPDYIIILSWNFKQEIIEKLRKFYDGKFIIPIPHFEIIN
jgi:ubiquinone/menaquinone biosynthesis C-methylase UbiE